MSRKLVHVERVKEILSIKDADKIELAKVLGWQVVVKKGEVKTGDLAVYFEIDSFLPIEPRFEFLRTSSYKKLNVEEEGTGILTESEGFRLRTVKMRGQLSQGLLLSLSAFPELSGTDLVEGLDVTSLLKVKLYEAPIPANMKGSVKGGFPGFIKKTDQERLQNLPEYFEKYKNVEFEVTEKIDGTSATFYFNNGQFGVCSRNLELKDDGNDNIYWKIVKKYNIESLLKKIGKNIALQGEIAGEGINGNPLRLKGQELFVFDIYDINQGRLLTQHERAKIMQIVVPLMKDNRTLLENKEFTTFEMSHHVPIIDIDLREFRDKIFMKFSTIDEFLSYARGKSLLNSIVKREGLVFKSKVLIDGQIVSFKVINNDVLLEEKEREQSFHVHDEFHDM